MIPADKSRFGAFDALTDKTQEQVRAIIEEAAKSSSPGTDGSKIGALYSAFMDEARIDSSTSPRSRAISPKSAAPRPKPTSRS